MPLRFLTLLLLAPLPLLAQVQTAYAGRQVIEDNGVLLEVTYTSERVRVRVFDLEGQPLDLSSLWVRRCEVTVQADKGHGWASRVSKVELVRPQEGLPYLEARHQLGALHEQCGVWVHVRLKNLRGRGDRSDRFKVGWERREQAWARTRGVRCRQAEDPPRECPLCRRSLCRR